MNKFRAASVAMAIASGLMLGMAGSAWATDGAPVASSGSSGVLIDLASLLDSGSGGSGSSFGITVGDDEEEAESVADAPVSTGSAGLGTGSSPLCTTNPTSPGCPK
ncbi:hypothetical protein ACIGO9_31300 [Nocardia asteroides]|uniref:hypothetical protein n=1 Tax=Nocardia asteroides TaxID=1824 RepID=UPI0037C73B9F